MARYNIFYKLNDKVIAIKGFYKGMVGTVLGMRRPFFEDDQFYVKFNTLDCTVWVNSWDLDYYKGSL